MDSRILILLLQISLVLSESINLSEHPCYKPNPINYRSARIVGGFNAIKGETPYMSAVTRSGGNVFCGASIISEKFLILSSHCLCNNQNKIIKPSQIRVYVGVSKVSDIKEFNGSDQAPIEVHISEIIIHPDYSCGKKSDSDIALLKLTKPIKFSENIQSLCLATDDSKLSQMALVSGYGMNHENYSIAEKPEILQAAQIPLWENEDCQEKYSKIKRGIQISHRQICAGGRNGVDSCYSDSGSPLIDTKSGELIGIVSNGIGCGRDGIPGIYIRISKFIDWIKMEVQKA